MIISDQQREENYQEYIRLLNDSDYIEVTFDDQSGGVSAIHSSHRFDKQIGPNGIKRGYYEYHVLNVYRKAGHSVILLKESEEVGKKQYDGLLDSIPCEIKTIERIGRWTIRTKIGDAIKQGAIIVVLYFPEPMLFSQELVQNGWKDYIDYSDPFKLISEIQIQCIVNDQIRVIEKPSW